MEENFPTICYSMFEHACAFADCAESIYREPNYIKNRTKYHSVVGIVNSTLACEIFLKTLLVIHGELIERLKGSKGHNLKVLWKEYAEKDNMIAVSVETKLRELFKTNNENMFDELLDNISNAFSSWRYIYEHPTNKINLNFLMAFEKSLREICCNQLHKKSWNEYWRD